MSDHHGQLGEGVGDAGSWPHVDGEIVEAPPEVLDEGMPGDDDPGGSVTLQPSHRSKSGLEPSVVGLKPVVRMDLGDMEGGGEHLVEDPGIEAVPVGGDLDWGDPGAADRLGE